MKLVFVVVHGSWGQMPALPFPSWVTGRISEMSRELVCSSVNGHKESMSEFPSWRSG